MTAIASRFTSARRASSACAPTSPKRSACRQGRARGHRPGRRLIRHEGRGVSRIYLRAARGARARPAGEVDRRALGKLCLRQPRPQSRRHRRTRARRRRQIPRRALDELRQYRRVPVAGRADAGHDQRGEERAGHVPHAADRSLDQVRVHQYVARLRLSRRRPAGGQLLHGAADRRRRGRDGHRPLGAAQAQSDQPARLALQDRIRRHLRQRRLRGADQTGRSNSPTAKDLRGASARAASAASCAASASAIFSKSPRRRRRSLPTSNSMPTAP